MYMPTFDVEDLAPEIMPNHDEYQNGQETYYVGECIKTLEPILFL